MKRDELRRILEVAGRQDAPPRSGTEWARPDGPIGPRAVGRSPWRAVAAVAAAAVVLVGVLLVVRDDGDEQQLVTEPVTSSTTIPPTSSTAAPVTTTIGAVPSTTTPTSTTVPPTTTAPPATTTTTAAPTTTTVPPEEPLALTCITTQDPDPAVTCEWSASTRAGFDHYRLWKHTGDGPDQEVYAGGDRRAVDTAVLVGARLFYEVTALAADGTLLGHGTTMITCC